MFTLKYKFEPFMHINECYDNITEIKNMLYQLGNPATQNCRFSDCKINKMADVALSQTASTQLHQLVPNFDCAGGTVKIGTAKVGPTRNQMYSGCAFPQPLVFSPWVKYGQYLLNPCINHPGYRVNAQTRCLTSHFEEAQSRAFMSKCRMGQENFWISMISVTKLQV